MVFTPWRSDGLGAACHTVTAFTIGSSAVMAALALVHPGRRVPGGVVAVGGGGLALAATSVATMKSALKMK